MENHSHQHSQHQNHDGHESDDHSKHRYAVHEYHRMMIEDCKNKLWNSMAFTIDILSLSLMILYFFGFEWVFRVNFTF